MSRLIPIALLAGSIALALAVLALALAALSRNPAPVLTSVLQGAFGSRFGFSETLLRTVPVLLCALAAALPAEAGLVNIGGEGQLLLGAIGAVVAAGLAPAYPILLVMVLMVLSALAFGAAWGAIPGVLRARFGTTEALVSLFLNYIAFQLLQYLVHGPMKDPGSFGWPMSKPLVSGLLVGGLGNTRVHSGLFVAVALAVLFLAAVRYTRLGTELRAVGLSSKAAANVGIPVNRILFFSMVVGGSLAGLAGYYEIAAVQHRLRTDVSLGFGYSGFLVAWMSRGKLWLIVPVSVLIGGLISSAENLQIVTGLPAATADIVQGLLLLFVLVGRSAIARMQYQRAVQKMMEGAGAK
jgi:ABC-type uncharacterized transport system permease subunit